MIASRRKVLAVLAGWAVAGPALAQSPVEFRRSSLEVVGSDGRRHRFQVELAETSPQLERGLMFRRALAADAGMLFDFGRPRPVSMWMKNTLIPLDMLFIAIDGTVIGVHERAVPQSLAVIESPGPAKAVLEVNGGTLGRLGLGAGAKVIHPWFGP